MQLPQALQTLLNGQILDLDGLLLVQAEGTIQAGDLYVGDRSTSPQLFIAKKIVYRGDVPHRVAYVVPTCGTYPHDDHECVKVQEAPCRISGTES